MIKRYNIYFSLDYSLYYGNKIIMYNKTMNEFELSYYSSVIIQFLFPRFKHGYTLNVVPSLHTLKYALNIEFFVSLIEIVVYIWIGINLGNYSSVMKKRYIDWFITTNALMVSFSLYLYFSISKRRGSRRTITFE